MTCDCSHTKELHYDSYGSGCSGLNSAGFPCECRGYVRDRTREIVKLKAERDRYRKTLINIHSQRMDEGDLLRYIEDSLRGE
jgi:hypothetical protein